DDDPEVDLPREDRLVHARRRVVRERELDPRVLAQEGTHELGQEVRAERLVTADDERSRVVALDSSDPLLGSLQDREDLEGVRQELLTGARQTHTASLTEKERRPEAFLERFHGDGDRRLAHP